MSVLEDIKADMFDTMIKEQTQIKSVPLCPELKLYQVSEVIPLWEYLQNKIHVESSPPPYWAVPWAGGCALARYILDHPELVSGKRVLDFAAGSGLVALACWLSGAQSAEASDIDPLARTAINLNAGLNACKINVSNEDLVGFPSRWDIVLAGDICYEQPMSNHIWPWLKQIAAAGTLVLLADPGRAYLPTTNLALLENILVPTSLDIERTTTRIVGVYRLV